VRRTEAPRFARDAERLLSARAKEMKERERVESFVARIYRRNEGDSRRVVGIVEIVEDGRPLRCTDMQELWEILVADNSKPRARRQEPQARGLVITSPRAAF